MTDFFPVTAIAIAINIAVVFTSFALPWRVFGHHASFLQLFALSQNIFLFLIHLSSRIHTNFRWQQHYHSGWTRVFCQVRFFLKQITRFSKYHFHSESETIICNKDMKIEQRDRTNRNKRLQNFVDREFCRAPRVENLLRQCCECTPVALVLQKWEKIRGA